MTTLTQLDSQATKRWKVGIVRITFESVTVWGKNPQEAAEAFSQGAGSPAETWGPLDAVMAAAEMGTPEASSMHLDAKHWLTGASPDADRTSDPPLPDRPKL